MAGLLDANPMTYPAGGEVILTTTQARILKRLLAILSGEQLDQLAGALEEVTSAGHGSLTIRIKNGHPWIIDKTITDKLELTGTK